MKIELNTGIMGGVIDVGMYESVLDPRYMFDSDEDEINKSEALTDEEKEYFFDKAYSSFNNDRYKETVAGYAMKALRDFFDDIENEIKITLCDGGTINSPREYNFRSDEFDFTVEVEQAELDKILPAVQNNEKFWKYAERYKSHDGFISFMPCYKDEYIKAIKGKDIVRALAMYLGFLYKENSIPVYNPYNEYIYESISGNHSLTEFIDDEDALDIWDKAWCAVNDPVILNQISLLEAN